jgi:hypothetical protein
MGAGSALVNAAGLMRSCGEITRIVAHSAARLSHPGGSRGRPRRRSSNANSLWCHFWPSKTPVITKSQIHSTNSAQTLIFEFESSHPSQKSPYSGWHSDRSARPKSRRQGSGTAGRGRFPNVATDFPKMATDSAKMSILRIGHLPQGQTAQSRSICSPTASQAFGDQCVDPAGGDSDASALARLPDQSGRLRLCCFRATVAFHFARAFVTLLLSTLPLRVGDQKNSRTTETPQRPTGAGGTERSEPVRLGIRHHHTRSLCGEGPAQSAQWLLLAGLAVAGLCLDLQKSAPTLQISDAAR